MRSPVLRIWRSDADRPYFWPRYLGEKGQTFDFLVELVDAGEKTPFFFVQVKTTRKEYTTTQRPPRLRIEVSENDVRRMVAYPRQPTSLACMKARNEPSLSRSMETCAKVFRP